MTVRPRYTARMKARDAALVAGTVWAAVAPVLTAMAHQVVPVVTAGARHFITARYTDPKDVA